MEGDADGPENATETDTLVNNESEISEDPYEKAQETSTLLAEMAGQSVAEVDETEDSRHYEAKATSQHHHSYHMKNKYTFRSDSVYSDVIPMSATQQSQHRTAETRDKSGSLSSLKAKESKWKTLKKKLLTHSHSHSASTSSEKQAGDEKDKGTPQANKSNSLQQKRSLFQRAKTLSILPVHKTSKDKDESHHHHQKKVVVQEKPPELFNVGGEMNMIPLELLIDVNDLHIQN